MPAAQPRVILGSGSPYRRELLSRLLPHFEITVPNVDETRQPGEAAPQLAQRLADLKAAQVARMWPGTVVIGSDQVAECDGEIMGKPDCVDRAIRQLMTCAGKDLFLHTAVCVSGPANGQSNRHLDRTRLRFRPLTGEEIARYVERDRPLDCAGGFKFESLGVALFSEVQTSDPTAIQGLPLLWLSDTLTRSGVRIL